MRQFYASPRILYLCNTTFFYYSIFALSTAFFEFLHFSRAHMPPNNKPSFETEIHYVDNGDGGQIHCEYFYSTSKETSAKNGVVFLVDGVCNNGLQFEAFIDRCVRTHCVIRFDYRGHGRSSNASGKTPLTVNACVSDMKTVLEHFYGTHPKLKKKVTLISYSLGAQVALKFASEEVERVNGVGIVNGTLEPAFYGLFRSEMLSDGIIRALRWSSTFQLFVAFWIRVGMVLLSLNGFFSSLLASYFVKASAKNFKPFWKHARRVQARSYISFLVDAHSKVCLDILEYLGSAGVDMPLFCIVGMKDTLVRTEKTVDMVHRIAPECEICKVKDGCHALLVHDKHKEQTARVLVEFANRCALDVDKAIVNGILG